MLTLEGFTLADKNTRTLEMKLTKASDKDVTVSLMYDASLFSKIAGNYSGYELGDASLAEIATTQKNNSCWYNHHYFWNKGNKPV